MISTRRRLEFAAGYIALGLVDEGAAELEAIEGPDRLSVEVMQVRVDLYLETKQWDLLLAVSRELMRRSPEHDKGIIFSAYALRELGRVSEAREILLEAESRHSQCALLHYNLACYHCLLGELAEAKLELAIACRMHPDWKTSALDDGDLRAIWGDIKALSAVEG